MEYFSSLKYFLRNYPRRTISVLVASLAVAALEMVGLSLLLPMIMVGAGNVVDNPLTTGVQQTLESFGLNFDFYTLFLLLAFFFSIKIATELALGLFIAKSSVLIARSFRERIIDALNNVSWDYLTTKPPGLVINLLSQEVDRAAGIFGSLQRVTVSALMSIAYLGVGIVTSFELIIAALCMGGAGVLLARPLMQMARRAGAGQVESLRDLSSDLAQGMQVYKAFKAMGRERALLANLSRSNDAFVDANVLKVRAEKFLHASQQLLFVVAVIVAVFAAREGFGVGLVEIGFLALVLMRLNSALANMLKKVQAIGNLHYTLDKVDAFAEELSENCEYSKGKLKPDFAGTIYFENVSFFRGARRVLDNVSFEIPEAGLTVIVGPSGSGKTTIIDLICGFHVPNTGRIMIGKNSLAETDRRQWRKNIGYVAQEPVLLSDTIARNIAAFDDSISDEMALRSLKLAGGESILEALEHGLQTHSGVAGQMLSGGERQRITIARALASGPKLLILDEPTASLDEISEAAIIETLHRISMTIPVIAISHQPALGRVADTMYELKDGKLVLTKCPSAGDEVYKRTQIEAVGPNDQPAWGDKLDDGSGN